MERCLVVSGLGKPEPRPAAEPRLEEEPPASSIFRKGGGVAFREGLDLDMGLEGRLRSIEARTSLLSSSSDSARLLAPPRAREDGRDMLAEWVSKIVLYLVGVKLGGGVTEMRRVNKGGTGRIKGKENKRRKDRGRYTMM